MAEKAVAAEKSTRDLVHEMDSQIGDIGLAYIALNDARDMVAHLREDMDNLDPVDVRFYFNEYHRVVRIVDYMMTNAVAELKEAYNQADHTRGLLHEKEVKRIDN